MIVAAPAPQAASLVAPVAERAAAALSQLTYGAFLVVAVETCETASMPYDDVYAIATPAACSTCSPTRRTRCAAPRGVRAGA